MEQVQKSAHSVFGAHFLIKDNNRKRFKVERTFAGFFLPHLTSFQIRVWLKVDPALGGF
jgi:hypothetical protein